MKNFLAALLSFLLISSNAFALPACSQYGPNCILSPVGLTELLTITPLEYPNGTYNYYGFSESEFASLGLNQYVTYYTPGVPDSAPAGPPNPMEVKAIQELYVIANAKPQVYFGSTLQTAPIMYTSSATVGSGVAVFQLTKNGLSGGTPIFPNGPNMDSINAFVSDATASYQMSYALSNSNKTLTITANKLTTANILTGILGQSAANNAVVRVTVWGN
jgi:hypothetical protein